MASSSSPHQQNQELNAFPGIGPAGKRRKVCESSRLFDVFINHRGPDVKSTLATQLYNSLVQLGIPAFLDSEEKELGTSFPSTIETAILSAKVHVAIFSKTYAESAWCLAELVLMLQSNAKIIPVFYQVKPSDLRHIETGVYAQAFVKYEEKGRYPEKLNEWKQALQSLSLIAGEEFNSFSDWDCQKIVAAVQKEVQKKTCLHVAQHPVGLDKLVEDFETRCRNELVEEFENQCEPEEGKHKAKIVGIFGMGGAGKTTLAKELCNRKKSNYSKVSFLFDVREASVKSKLHRLQRQLLKDLFDKEPSFKSTEEGIRHLKDHLERKPHLSFLIVVDDIDHVEQLNALRVMDILDRSCNSLVIVTTRDAGVLITAGITVGYNLKVMNRNCGRELFCWHAFSQPHPYKGYEEMVDDFLKVCRGLPLSLLVLGRHVHGRDHRFWESELIKARKTQPQEVKKRLRISFDALDDEEKQVFMDVACFFLLKPRSIAERLLEGSGWNAHNAIETLKDKCLIEKEDITFWYRFDGYGRESRLRMHDHLRDLGRELAVELSPPHRLWRPQDLTHLELMGFKTILARTDVRCFHSIFDESMGSRVTFFMGPSNNLFEMSASLSWLELEGNSSEQPSIPSWIPLQNLQYLKIKGGQLKTLWENSRQAPSQLKELQISKTSLKEFPDLLGISKDSLENGGNSSSVKVPMSGLEKLEIEISGEKFVSKILISGIDYPGLKSIKLHGMENLMEVNLASVKTLNCLDISQCPELKKLSLGHSSCLERITIVDCKHLESVSGISNLAKLVELEISGCGKQEFDYLRLRGMNCLKSIKIDGGVKVKYFELEGCQILKEFPDLLGISKDSLENMILENGGESSSVKAPMSCLKNLEIEISGENFVSKILISGIDYPRLKSIKLHGMENLMEVNLTSVKTLQRLDIKNCKKLERFTGTSDLRNLELLNISQCPELKKLSLTGTMNCLKSIEFDESVKVKYFELEGCQILKTLQFGCEELVELIIRGCRELRELPAFIGASCLERIIIDLCDILDLQFKGCQNLRSLSGNFTLGQLTITECPELEELPSLANVSFRNVIESCEKLQNISGIEEMHFPLFIRLSYCSNALIRNCIHKLKSVPLDGMEMIGRAADGAESSLNENLFCDAHIAADAVTDAFTHKICSSDFYRSSLIGCFLVVVDSSTSVQDINESLPKYSYDLYHDSPIQVREGEWIITMVACGESFAWDIQKISGVLMRKGIMKKGFWVELKEGEKWKSVVVLRTIIDKLHHL